MKVCVECKKHPAMRRRLICQSCCNKALVVSRNNPAWKAYQKEYQAKLRENQKALIFDHYGRKCVCCGETEPAFLTLDHVNNDGAVHRRNTRNFYHSIVQQGFPDTIRVLCWNCNCGRRRGECPHVLKAAS